MREIACVYATGKPAFAEEVDSPLVKKLRQSREDLAACGPLLEAKQWEDVRKPINNLLPSLTFKGYTGESVKSRAAAWAAAGELERSKDIIAKRATLVVSLSKLDTALFAVQTNKKKDMLSPEELQDALTSTTGALDALIAKMGCPTRVVAGQCEILPLELQK